MATIQRVINLTNVSYRVFIRKRGFKTLTKTFPTKKLAKQFALRMEADATAMLSIGGMSSKTSFKNLVDQYLLKEYKGTRPKEQYKKLSYWMEILGEKLIIDITKYDISNGLELLPKDLSNATINRYKAAIGVVFSYACRVFDLPENPVRKIPSLPENNERIRFLSEAERTRLFKACRASKWTKLYLLVLMAITTGSRKGELMNLRWSDIDLDRQTAFVETTKNGQPKVMPLTDDVVTELTRFSDKETEFIFNSELKPDRPMCFTKQWIKALKLAEIEDFRFHDLRHTCASYLAQNGASLLEIAEILNHKQIQVTKRYAHLCISHKAKLINRVMGGI